MSGNSIVSPNRRVAREPILSGAGGAGDGVLPQGEAQQEPINVDPEGARAGLDSFIAGEGGEPAAGAGSPVQQEPAGAGTAPGTPDPRDIRQTGNFRNEITPGQALPGPRSPTGGNSEPGPPTVANRLFSQTEAGASVANLAGRLRRRRGRSSGVLGGR